MIVLENILSQEIVQRLGWTLLHFIWQAVVVSVLLAILLRALCKSSANLRYIISCLALVLIILLPAITIKLIPVSVPQSEQRTAQNLIEGTESRLQEEKIKSSVLHPPSSVSEELKQSESIPLASTKSWKQRAAEFFEPALPYIVSGWLFGVFGLSIWHVGGWTQLQRLRKKMVKNVDMSLQVKLKELAGKLKVKRAVLLLESALVEVPTVVGWLKPVILLPATALTGLSTDQLDAMLAHELAHIKRYDYLVNLLQTVVEILGFYHPAVWWISHKIRLERENCCDDLAVSISGDRVRYARALTLMEEIRVTHGELAVAASGGNLFRRICRLLGKDSKENFSFSWIPAATTILLIIALLIPTTFALTTSKGQKSDVQVESKRPVQPQGLKLNELPAGWRLNRVSGFLSSIGHDSAVLKVVPTPAKKDESWKEERLEFEIRTLEGKRVENIYIMPGYQYQQIDLQPDEYLLRYTRERGKNPDNFKMRCWEFLVDLSQPGEYEFKFTPKLGQAEITGSLGGCYAINFEKVGEGPWIRGFAYQYPSKQYLLDGLPPGTYRLSAVTMHKSPNVFVSQAEVTVGAEDKATVNMVPPPTGSCSLKGSILGEQKNYKTPWPDTWPESQGKWYILIRKPGSKEVRKVEAYEALTMDSLYVVRGSNITQRTKNQAQYQIEGVAPGTYTITAIEDPSWAGCTVTRQQSKKVTLKANEEAMLDFDLSDTPTVENPRTDSGKIISSNENEQKTDLQVMFQKSESLKKLTQLGLAAIMYADEHDNNLPKTLQELKAYIKDEQCFKWLLDNIEYLGKGKSTQRSPAEIPIAFDKSLQNLGQGTNVLFVDAHVEFCNPDRLEKLVTSSDIEKRVESGRKLSNVGKTLFIYANDHEDKYPDSLSELRSYLKGEDLEWASANVRYLG